LNLSPGTGAIFQFNDILGMALVNLADEELAVADDLGPAPPRLAAQFRATFAHPVEGGPVPLPELIAVRTAGKLAQQEGPAVATMRDVVATPALKTSTGGHGGKSSPVILNVK
jgi:hypothetical protein